jgi:putative acetyltransferase
LRIGAARILQCAKTSALSARELAMRITVDNLQGSEITALLQEHLSEMRSVSPPESVHALDLSGLRKPDITFWTVWLESDLAACGALKELSFDHGEIKSMRTARLHRRKGIAAYMVQYMIQEAARRGYRTLSLETGCQPHFAPARSLYGSFGFQRCGPFGDYVDDPNSVFMTKVLRVSGAR